MNGKEVFPQRIVSAVLALVFLPLAYGMGQVTGLAGWNIYVDPGHSQRENKGIYGYSEAEKNLGVARHLKDLLISKTDISAVYLSRTNNQVSVSLSDRTSEANNLGVAWYHSIHSNAPSTTANDVLLLWGQYEDGREKIPNGGRAMSDIMAVLLADGMRTSPYKSIGDCSYYTWSDWCQSSGGPYLHINRVSTMPSELSEAGYHTNPVQNQLNMNDKWKRLEAYTFFWSILQFHGIARPPVRILTGIIDDIESGISINGAVAAAGGVTDTTDTYESLFYKYSVDTDQLHNGFYFLEGLSGSTVQLAISADGYLSDTIQVALENNFFTFKDIHLTPYVPTRVVSTVPAQDAINASTWGPITINFSKPMDRASVRENLVPPKGITGTMIWANDDKRLIYLPDPLAPGTHYTLTISRQAVDKDGNYLETYDDSGQGGDFILDFTTGTQDEWPPEMVSIFPPANGTGIQPQPVVNVLFNEPLEPATVNSDIVQLIPFGRYEAVEGRLRHYTTLERSLLCLYPVERLMLNSDYVIVIRSGLKDLAGNIISKTRSYSFHTSADPYFVNSIDDFEGDVTGNWRQPGLSQNPTGVVSESTTLDTSRTVANLVYGGSQSMELDYAWDEGAAEWLIRVELVGGPPKSIQFTGGYALQAYVFSNGSGNQLRFCVDDNLPVDALTNHEVSPWIALDWIGWRLVSWDMAHDGTGAWRGDGNLDGVLRFDSIQLTHAPGAATAGTLYVDDLQVAYNLGGDSEPLPVKFVLHPNYPNPFNPTTTITYDISQPADVRLNIYDLLGRRVKTLVNGWVVPGHYWIVWDGTDDSGWQLASGVYICHLQAADVSLTRKMALVR